MIALILAVAVSLFFSLFAAPVLIRFLNKHQLGQFIRQDGPESHFTKRGTPTMGGIVIVISTVLGYLVAYLWMYIHQGRLPRASGLLALGLMFFMGLVGFVDDLAKIRTKQSLGLTPRAKIVWQLIIGIAFAILCNCFPDSNGVPPASNHISFINDIVISFDFAGKTLGTILFIIWVNLIITAWTNAVNLTDGLDGLATGVSLFAFLAYVIICFWEFTHLCHVVPESLGVCYVVRDAWDLTLIAGTITGSCFGFLWWNAAPAKIFMGDTGSFALGGAFAAISILSHTQLLAIIIGGVFVLECVSDIIQVGYFKLTCKRVFKMAPIHHHFELKGWAEVNVVIRFWIISALCAGVALSVFYGGWLQGMIFD
ncbi:MAG: phospho-N-acetylmuramoyl-pentapeptide-transferase [Candidatus Ancillula trichonymphae]|jgi:phospho-N-acetylmuramoyl-pentapeptide-transferase|nr:phospho-N-acetylmuramoyl-pentapeptide-transferase [Candidatus Ancillula trichonymphae]